jgi:outer membrane protein insertion porin family
VQSISGLQIGDKIMLPGGDAFSKAITNLWRQKLFSNIQIFITAVQENNIDIEINVQERPKLSNFKFVGVKKTEADELPTKAGLVKSTIITENTRRNAIEAIQKYYVEKGFKNVQIRVEEKPDPTFVNSNILTFYIDKGKKVKVNEVNFYGNEQVSDLKLKKQMKGTKEMTKLTLFPSETPSQKFY